MDKYIPNNSLETNVGKQLQQKAFIIFGLSFETWKLQTSLHNVAFAKQEVSGVYSLVQSTKSSQALEEGSALLPSLSLLIQQAPVIFSDVPLPQDGRRSWCGAVWSAHPLIIASSAKPILLPGKWSAAVPGFLPTRQRGSSCQTPTGIYKIVYCRANGGKMIKRAISVCSSEV